MVPQDRTPPPEPPRNYIVQSKHQPPPARTTRIIRRQTQTPPPLPLVREAWNSGPRRQINSDTEIIDRQQRMRREDSEVPVQAEMYHIDAIIDDDRYTPSQSPVHTPYDNNTPPPRGNHQGNGNRKQRRVEPWEQNNHNEPEPQFERRVYKKLPPGKYGPPNDEYIPNENPPRMARKTDRNRPPARYYSSSPQIQSRFNRSPEPIKNPSGYHRSVDDY